MKLSELLERLHAAQLARATDPDVVCVYDGNLAYGPVLDVKLSDAADEIVLYLP